MRKTIGVTVALWLGLAGTAAQATEAHQCLTEDEARSLIVAVLPDLVVGLSTKCAAAVASAGRP